MNSTESLLFRRLEASGIRYVVLRNYEQLCDSTGEDSQATDIDLVIATEDIPKWRAIAVSLAKDAGWDALTECDHFTKSSRHEHDIEIFRYYRYSDRCFLQVDLFHAYLLWGLPFMTEEEMLQGRVQDARRGLTRIDPVKENTFRLLQLQGLIGWEHSTEKMARYRDRVLRFDAERRDEFRGYLESRFPGYVARILDALEREDWTRYRKTVTRAKATFFSRFVRQHPLLAAELLSARALEGRKRYLTEPCGRLLKVRVDNPRTRARLSGALDKLRHSNFIDHWVERKPGALPDRIDLVVREQGGLVIQWTESDQADLVVRSQDDDQTICRWVLDLLVQHHTALFLRAAKAVKAQPSRERLVRV
ncbi:MAG: hypothetical protein ACR2NN_17415 [Bryobacteraceae bacterium]